MNFDLITKIMAYILFIFSIFLFIVLLISIFRNNSEYETESLICERCQGKMYIKKKNYREHSLGKEIIIRNLAEFRCENCGNIVYNFREKKGKKRC